MCMVVCFLNMGSMHRWSSWCLFRVYNLDGGWRFRGVFLVTHFDAQLNSAQMVLASEAW